MSIQFSLVLSWQPDFSDKPLDSQEKVNSWLKFYEMDAILVCLGEVVSHDPVSNFRCTHFIMET